MQTIIMLNIRNRIYILIFLAVLLALTPSRVLACSCFYPSFWDSFSSTTAVFTGKVTHIETTNGLKVTFSVLKVWKGPRDEHLVVTTAMHPVSCGFPFSESDTFLVYAYGTNDQLITSSCSRTAHISVARADISKLNVITNPFLIALFSIATGLLIRGFILYSSRKRLSAS